MEEDSRNSEGVLSSINILSLDLELGVFFLFPALPSGSRRPGSPFLFVPYRLRELIVASFRPLGFG